MVKLHCILHKYSNYKIIACEKYINGNFNLIKKIKQNSINNILIHNGNVHEILDKNEKYYFFDKVFIFSLILGQKINTIRED